jgi:hypothetical protein
MKARGCKCFLSGRRNFHFDHLKGAFVRNIVLKFMAALLLGVVLPKWGLAAAYYVSNSGDDTHSGLSAAAPWKTVGHVNSVTLTAGDQVLFNRGDVFYGSLATWCSGAAGAPITYGAYGGGNKPVITGFTTVSSWTNTSGNVYQSVDAVFHQHHLQHVVR